MSGKQLWRNLNLVVLTVIFSQVACAEEPAYQFVYRFQAGQFFHFEVDDQAEMTTQANVNQSKSFQQTHLLKSYRVVVLDDHGGATLEPIVEKVRMSSQTGDKGIVSFDSTKDETPPKEFEKVASSVGRALARFHVAANGRLLKVTMLVTDVPKNFSEAAEKADPTINFLVVFPEKAIKVADKWSEKYETPVSVGSGLIQQINLIRTYELVKVVGNVASIKFRTSLLTPMNEPEILRQLLQQTPTGTVEFDLQQGRILSRSIQIDDKVIGAFGPQTLLQARGESIEKLVTPSLPPRVSNGAANQPLK